MSGDLLGGRELWAFDEVLPSGVLATLLPAAPIEPAPDFATPALVPPPGPLEAPPAPAAPPVPAAAPPAPPPPPEAPPAAANAPATGASIKAAASANAYLF